MTRRRAARWAIVLFVCSGAAGCGKPPATVSGTVTYRGKPVTAGSVLFYGPDKQIARGVIGSDGRYSVPNVPRGTCAVTVQTPPRPPEGLQLKQQLPPIHGGPTLPKPEPADPVRAAFPARYALPDESGLSAVVDRDQVTFDIVLTP